MNFNTLTHMLDQWYQDPKLSPFVGCKSTWYGNFHMALNAFGRHFMCSYQDNTSSGKQLDSDWLTILSGNWFNQQETSQGLVWSPGSYGAGASVLRVLEFHTSAHISSCMGGNETCGANRVGASAICPRVCGFVRTSDLLMLTHTQIYSF